MFLNPCFWTNGLPSSFLSAEDETQKRSNLFFFEYASYILIFYLPYLDKFFSSTFLEIITAATIFNFFERSSFWPSVSEPKHQFLLLPYSSILHFLLLYSLLNYTESYLKAEAEWVLNLSCLTWHMLNQMGWMNRWKMNGTSVLGKE